MTPERPDTAATRHAGTDLAALADISARRHLASVLRSARWGAADESEVLATVARIRDLDPDSWVSEWVWSAGELWSAANQVRSSDPGPRAGALYLRAATYYGAALSQVARSSEHDRFAALWRRQRCCWEHAVGHAGGQRIEIPYARVSLPAYFFRAPGDARCRRPLVIMHNGASVPTSAMWGLGGAAAADRGYHWMTFDGPGQQAALHERGLCFRPDWEAVLASVLDAIVDHPEVDGGRIAAIGVGQAGYLLPRALVHEHRLAAAAVAPGVIDMAAAWAEAFPARLQALLRHGDAAAFDRELRAELLFSPGAERWLRAGALPYGLADAPLSRLFQALAGYRVETDGPAVRTPLLIIDPGPKTSWPNQSRLLQRRVGAGASLVEATPPEREAQLFAWLEGVAGS
jgi:hypothetical protein